MPKYRLKKWRHPSSDVLRIYLNGLETTSAKVWFERGERRGTDLPPVYHLKLCVEGNPSAIDQGILDEIRLVFSEMDLFYNTIDWARLGKAADW